MNIEMVYLSVSGKPNLIVSREGGLEYIEAILRMWDVRTDCRIEYHTIDATNELICLFDPYGHIWQTMQITTEDMSVAEEDETFGIQAYDAWIIEQEQYPQPYGFSGV